MECGPLEAWPTSCDNSFGGNIGSNKKFIGPINGRPPELYRELEEGEALNPNSSNIRTKGDMSDDLDDDDMEIDRCLTSESMVKGC